MDKFLKREVVETSSDGDTDDSGSGSDTDSDTDAENTVHTQQAEERIGNTARKHSAKKKTSRQIGILEAAYKEDTSKPHRDSERIKKLMESTKLERCRIQQWFATRRNRDKKRGLLIPSATTTDRGDDEKDPTTALPGGTASRKTPEQVKILLAAYEEDSSTLSINSVRARRLGEATGLDLEDIRIWFYSRKQKLKKPRDKVRCRDAPSIGLQPEQFKVLRKAFEEDPSFVYKFTERADKLVADTGLRLRYIQNWFRLSRSSINAPPSELKKTGKQTEVLLAAYEQDPEVPVSNSDRMAQLCSSTGLTSAKVAGWFNSRRARHKAPRSSKFKTPEQLEILRASHASDPTAPLKNSVRMEKLIARTGLEYNVIGDWFRSRKRNRSKSGVLAEQGLPKRNVIKEGNISSDTKPLPCGSPSVKEELVSKGGKTRKCPICDCGLPAPAMSVVSIEEVRKMDKYFGSSLVHFLTYTRAVRICNEHEKEYRRNELIGQNN